MEDNRKEEQEKRAEIRAILSFRDRSWKEMEVEQKMCDALRELFAEELKEENERGMEQGMELGMERGIHLAKLIFKLSAQGSSAEEIAEKCDLPLKQVREILE